jgi:hypothetical protein
VTTLRCERYPHILVATAHGKVQFADGLAEVTDEQAEVLLAMPEEYGITLVAPDEDQDDDEPTAGGGEDPTQPAPEDTPPTEPAAPSEPVPPEPTPQAERPPQSAPKADWVAFADTQDPADHSSMTKQELIEQYGG